jgi:non-canonical (house-cleaning) NTP pyrophosphatase
LGSAEGIIGVLTKGRLTRKEYVKQAITMALINLENSI